MISHHIQVVCVSETEGKDLFLRPEDRGPKSQSINDNNES